MLKIVLAFWLSLATLSLAATKYVVPNGSGNGASWSAAAGPSVINNCASGDLIYLAGGDYGSGIPVNVSGVTIKRATAADHGDASGWQASMDKQAVFNSGWLVSGKDVTIDGNTWVPPGLPKTYGIKIKHASAAKGVDAGGSPGGLKCINLEIPGPGINGSKAEADGIHFPSNSTISGCAVYDTDALLFAWKGNTGTTIEYCYLYNASSNIVFSGNPQDPHPDVVYSGGMFTNGTMRWCVVANVTSEGVFFDQELPGDNMVFYGNIMFQGDCQTGNTPIQFQNGAKFGSVQCIANTFVDFNKSNVIGPGTTLGASSKVINNLFINYLPNWPTGVNNNGFSSTGIGTNQIINSASPFVTSGAFKWVKGSGNPPATRVTSGAPTGYNPAGMEVAFALADNSWAKGKAIAAPAGYNVDYMGRSGNDLGAVQSGGAAPTPTPPAPTPTPSATPTPTASPTPGNKFKTGDWVTPTAEVNVRNSPGGTIVGTHAPGDLGIVVSGPELAPLPQATTVAWYLIDWTTAPTSGHTGDNDLAKAAAPSPTPTPAPTPPQPTPTPSVTYKEWTNKLNTEQTKWIETHPPYPDGE
jgi:Right handed beta helix region